MGSPHIVGLSGTGGDFSSQAASGSSRTATVTPGQIATFTVRITAAGGGEERHHAICFGLGSATVNRTRGFGLRI